MGNCFHDLPPLKRFKLLQQQEDESPSSFHLPAKKRKESWDPPPNPTTSTTYCLPAKKRVCALQPVLLTPQKPISSFDLNVEYEPSPEKSPKLKKQMNSPSKTGIDSEEKQANEENQEPNEGTQYGTDESIPLSQCSEGEASEPEAGKDESKEVDDDDGIVCDVCQSTDGDPSDPIVLCDGCDVMVHATCYGDPLIRGIPEGDWFCARCQASSRSRKVKANDDFCCCLCPVKGGAVKPTRDGQWGHILCALLVPEVFFRDPKGREGIDCSRVPRRRWEEVCYICNSATGCAIECSEPKCSLAFHVSCGLKEDLCIEYKEARTTGAIVAGFCKAHTALWKKQQQTGKFKIVARQEHKK
ncbi:PREDICTED: protein Jade-1 [Nelumbo nucifera]|uniref:Protein Jade-1 n=1 Tax=Nelumbo nucifera TaxID=4432 RepID=A0A1U8AWV0_NELNU|nr:PREDICTED: protein Jade-1 [Nelumbo nucifera]